ncbi:MAG: hypothetical protein H0T83_01290 [Chthoniobacterales bacterium]|nr:hypothetical protein [Chthoniobacterales bacterium]
MSGASGDLAERGLQYTMDQWGEIMSQTEDYVRANPTRSLLYGVAAGFIIDRLPIFRILGALVRLLLMALKPAALVYGATKIYQAATSEE